MRLENLPSLLFARGTELKGFDCTHGIGEVRVHPDRILQYFLPLGFLARIAKNTPSPALNQGDVHHVGVAHQLLGKVQRHLQLVRPQEVLTLERAAFDTDRAIFQNISAVDNSTFIIIVALVSSELLKHFNLMKDCVHQVLIFSIRLVAWIKLTGRVECLFGLCCLPQCQVRLEQPFIDSRECCIKSDTGLAVFDCFAEHFEVDVAHGTVGQDLHARLNIARLSVQLDSPSVILPAESLVAFDFFSFSLWVGCSFYHFL